MHPSEKLNKNQYDNHYKEEFKMKPQNHDFQFYITRYPFPNGSIAFQTRFYKTSYQCKGFQLTNDKISRITGLNRLSSLIKLKQIVKSSTKQQKIKNEKFNNILVHSYSLYYEIVPNFILSPTGISIIKSLRQIEIKNIFKNIIQDIDHLISNGIFYLLDVQNIAISMTGKVKIYIPANNIIENIFFTDKHKKEMKSAANKVISCLQRHIENYLFSNIKIDVESVKTEIKKQLQSLQINSKNIESQIFTFNQNYQNSTENNYQLETQQNQNFQKRPRIRKSSQNINIFPDLYIQRLQNGLLLQKKKGENLKCVTAREYTKKQEEINQKQKQTKNIQLSNFKENDAFKQRMKDYQIKLQTLGHSIQQIKQEMSVEMAKKDSQNQKYQKKYSHDRFRSKTFANLPLINSQVNQIDQIVQKLSSSRLQIKKLLLNETDLRQSYHVQQQEQVNHRNLSFELKKQIQNLFDWTFPENFEDNPRPKIMSSAKNKEKDIIPKPTHVINQIFGLTKLEEIKQQKSNHKCGQNVKSKRSPDSFNQESSWGKHSPPGGNPFRQYGNFRIQYVIDEQALPNAQINDINEGGQIKVYHQQNIEPIKIKKQSKKHHFLTPLSHLQQNFRYSSLALQKGLSGQLLRMSIPENIYDPTQYDSMDTFEMQIGTDDKMPRIISKAAFRHTLFPSPIFGQVKPTKDVQKSEQRITVQKQQRFSRQDRTYKSVDRKRNKKQIKPRNGKQHDNLSDIRSRNYGQMVPKIIIREVIMTQPSMDVCDSLIVPKKVQNQKKSNQLINKKIQILQKSSRRESEYQRLSKTNKDVPRFINIEMSPDKNSYKNLQQLKEKMISPQGNKKALDKQKIKAILNRSKEIITKYKNLPIKKKP